MIIVSILAIVLAVGSTAFAGWLFWQMRLLQRRFDAALAGTSGDSIEEILVTHLARVSKTDKHLVALDQAYRRLADAGSLASQKISIVRFNSFGDTGGDQSFVLAVLDAHDSGYVLTSIHGREGTRVYVKPVDYGKSKYTLSSEESQALQQAAKRVPK